MLTKIPILGIPVTANPKGEILSYISSVLSFKPDVRTMESSPTALTVVTPNPEQVMLARANARFREVLLTSDIAIPDGSGLVWAAGTVGVALARIPGVDFMCDLCGLAASNGWSVVFLGGRHGVAERSFVALAERFPGLKGGAVDGPEMEGVTDAWLTELFSPVLRRLKNEDIRMVFVGLGAPKQEYVIDWLKAKWRSETIERPILFMAVGGSFDMLAGTIPRAPVWMRDAGLEWFWRLMLEPWRLGRQSVLIRFAATVLWNRLNGV